MDQRQRAEAAKIRAMVARDYGTRGPEWAELQGVLTGLEHDLAASHESAERKDAEIAFLRAERDLYLEAFMRLHMRVMDVVGEETTALALARAAGGMKAGETVIVPAPNGAAAHNGGAYP